MKSHRFVAALSILSLITVLEIPAVEAAPPHSEDNQRIIISGSSRFCIETEFDNGLLAMRPSTAFSAERIASGVINTIERSLKKHGMSIYYPSRSAQLRVGSAAMMRSIYGNTVCDLPDTIRIREVIKKNPSQKPYFIAFEATQGARVWRSSITRDGYLEYVIGTPVQHDKLPDGRAFYDPVNDAMKLAGQMIIASIWR